MEIGDVFVITPFDKLEWYLKTGKKIIDCKYPDKRFIIKGFSGTTLTVYYNDNRTNNNCLCSHCIGNKIEKNIGRNLITIVETRIQRERDLKLKRILSK